MIFVMATMATSCNDEMAALNEDCKTGSNELQDGIELEDGFLHFDSSELFNRTIEDLKNNAGEESRALNALSGFNSIHKMGRHYQSLSRSAEDTDDEIEEGSEDEYNVAKAEDLLKEDALTHVMDTTLRVGIEGKFYKITAHGTFFADMDKAEMVESAIASFNPENMKHISDDIYAIDEHVSFVDTYGLYGSDNFCNAGEGELLEYEPVDDETGNESRAATYYSSGNGNTSYYGLASYKWKNSSVWKKFWDAIRGKDVTKENKFNSNLRTQVEVFQVNYYFYASAGVKIKLQKRKKILFIKYWVSTTADEIVMGIENLYGYMNFNYNPQKYHYLDVFNTTVNNYGTHKLTMVYNGLSQIPILKNWMDEKLMTCFMGQNFSDRVVDFLKYPVKYSIKTATSDEIKNDLAIRGLRALNGKYLNDIKRCVLSTEPKVGLHFPSNGRMEVFVADGISSYGRRESKTIRFSQSAGFSFMWGSGFIGWLPEEFDLKKFSLFGACRVGNQWRGVRFTY